MSFSEKSSGNQMEMKGIPKKTGILHEVRSPRNSTIT